jgi:hypothetical protein
MSVAQSGYIWLGLIHASGSASYVSLSLMYVCGSSSYIWLSLVYFCGSSSYFTQSHESVAQCGYIWPQSLIRLRLSLAICISMAQSGFTVSY